MLSAATALISPLLSAPRSSTKRTGPIEASPAYPKESSSLCPIADVTPIPSAIMKGTAIGPVVAPPESKATALKNSGTKAATAKRRTMPIANDIFIEKPVIVLRKESATNTPTPSAIAATSNDLLNAGLI